MFMRIVEAEVREGKGAALESVYMDYVIPTLEKTDGCLFAGILQSIDRIKRYASLTLLEPEKKIQEYVNSGTYGMNLERIRTCLEESSEWKIQLTKDNTLEYVPVKQVSVIKSYPVKSGSENLSERVTTNQSYLRVLSLKIKSGREMEFKKIYKDKIQKELEKTSGCRYLFLIDNSDHDNEMISITLWDDLDSVLVYEQEGVFRKLLGEVKHTLAELYQWKMGLESDPDSAVSITSQDIDISKFTMVTGKNFN